uniref:Uncharacterized protein n=1 Tax=Rhizophora mucronata TaxID=61149 RepID=A0A2P2R1T1_RHIMU
MTKSSSKRRRNSSVTTTNTRKRRSNLPPFATGWLKKRPRYHRLT